MKINTIKNIGAGLLMLIFSFYAGQLWNHFFGKGGVLITIILFAIFTITTKKYFEGLK